MPREDTPNSQDSTLSHITVAVPKPEGAAVTKMSTSSARSSVGASSLNSTPPTSIDDSNAEADASKDSNRRQAARARSSLSTHEDANAADSSPRTSPRKRKSTRGSGSFTGKASDSRTVSGATLVDDDMKEKQEKLKKELGIAMVEWDGVEDEITHFLEEDEDEEARARRRSSRRNADGSVIKSKPKPIPAGVQIWSNGKLVEPDKQNATTHSSQTGIAQGLSKVSQQVSQGVRSLFPNMAHKRKAEQQEVEEVEETAAQEPPKPKKPVRPTKKYQAHGLYSGQTRESISGEKKKKIKGSVEEKENSVLPLPMFGTYKLLTSDGSIDYKLPYEVLNPLRKEEAPKDWSKLYKNRFVGDATASWSIKEHKKLGISYCQCVDKCDDSCQNRHMMSECNEDNCPNGENCGNRPFAELKFRSKNKNFSRLRADEKPEPNLWGIGVETARTGDRGYGVRAMRSFEPDQVIIEYCGEIITQEEADHRQSVVYKGKNDFYMMAFHSGMIIDATRGNICRFVNHSCSPNCRVEKWTVEGEPRMALFAGENGIMTGEELTYDYNFEYFSKNSIQACRCGSDNCRGVLGPKPKERPTKMEKIANVKNAVKGGAKAAAKGVKRGYNAVFGKGEGEDEAGSPQRKRSKINGMSAVSKTLKHITGSQLNNAAAEQLQKQKEKALREGRAKRAAEREAAQREKEEAERLLKAANDDEEDEDEEEEEGVTKSPVKAKTTSRRSMSTTIAVSDLPRASPRKARDSPRRIKSPMKKLQGMKEHAKDIIKSAKPAARTGFSKDIETPGSRVASQTKLLPSSSSKANMRQSKISFGTGSFGFNVSPKKRAASEDEEEDEDEEQARGPKIPKRSSSLAKATSRPSTMQSLAKSTKNVAATARLSMQGNKAVRKTVRAVSCAE